MNSDNSVNSVKNSSPLHSVDSSLQLGNQLILNRTSELPQDNWYMAAKKGEYPVRLESSATPKNVLLQIIDDAACEKMANRFAQDKATDPTLELLVDQDHFSDNTEKPSQAFGWIQNLQNRADGLWAQIAWTPDGAAAVKNKTYRFLSPVWNLADCEQLGNRRIRPTRLDKVAVTNEPNIKGMAPLKNRKESNTMDHKATLLQVLGLATDASDEQITAGIAAHATEIQNRKTELETIKNRVTELEKKELDTLVEKDLDAHADKITNRAEMKALLIANRENGLKMLGLMKAVPAVKALNRAEAQTPSTESDAEKLKNRKANQDALIEKTMNESRCTSRAQAYEMARGKQPDLFA
jgi:phage I-like protein